MQWFKDKDGNEFALDDETWAHIQEFHPEFKNVGEIESILLQPNLIVRSNWDQHSRLYYQRIRPRRYHVIVVEMIEKRIKTALTTAAIKEGEILWPKQNLML